MFSQLIGSQPEREATLGRAALSLLVHLAVIYGAVARTKGFAEPPPERIVIQIDDFPPPTIRTTAATPGPASSASVLAAPIIMPSSPVAAVPSALPPIDLRRQFEPGEFARSAMSKGAAAGGSAGGWLPSDRSNVFTETELDVPPRVVSPATPRYPPILATAGISGLVVCEFVIDTAGQAEPASIKIVTSTHPAFNEPAREAVLKTSFRPGRLRGQSVRVVVRQGVRFVGREKG